MLFNNVTIIDATNDNVTKTITVGLPGASPRHMAYGPINKDVYVTTRINYS